MKGVTENRIQIRKTELEKSSREIRSLKNVVNFFEHPVGD